jgi:prepilin-type processing-associated H-X9-DG protein
MVDILPYMEQQAAFQQIKSHYKGLFGGIRGMRAIALRELMAIQYPWMVCPSDESAKPSTEFWYWENRPKASSNYKGVIGDSVVCNHDSETAPCANTPWPDLGSQPDCHGTAGCNGLLWRNTYVRPVEFRTVTDGVSNTLIVGEAVVEEDYHSAAMFSDGDWASCGIPLNFFLVGLDTDARKFDRWNEVRGFKSLHPGGSQFAMADGSVHFLNESIAHETYRALSTRSGDETASLQN